MEKYTKESIQQLLTDQIPESISIEYKRDLPTGTDDDKKEFLADIEI